MNRTINDSAFRLIGISILSLFMLFSDDLLLPSLNEADLINALFNVLSVASVWHLNRLLMIWLRPYLLPRLRGGRRLLVTLLVCVLATTLFNAVFSTLRYLALHRTLTGYEPENGKFHLSFGSTQISLNAFGLDFFHAFFISTFFLVVYELLFYQQDSSRYQQQWEQSEREKEKLRVANMQSQLDVLKQQVNPHFLFNSLNSLSSLISEDPKQAELFVDKLSGVYRYVLRANEQHLTTLDAELQFIDAYYHLLQTRYGAGLSLSVSVHDHLRTSQLPPLTLQLLVENAVKHNVVSSKKPLSLCIMTDDQTRLVVQNTRQRKSTRVVSNGVGLANIVAKYQVLNLPHPSVEETEESFTVRLPLLVN